MKQRNIASKKKKKKRKKEKVKPSPAIFDSKVIVHQTTVSCSSFVQALGKYIHIFIRRQGEIHITLFCTIIQIE